jgi:hypothetical protein
MVSPARQGRRPSPGHGDVSKIRESASWNRLKKREGKRNDLFEGKVQHREVMSRRVCRNPYPMQAYGWISRACLSPMLVLALSSLHVCMYLVDDDDARDLTTRRSKENKKRTALSSAIPRRGCPVSRFIDNFLRRPTPRTQSYWSTHASHYGSLPSPESRATLGRPNLFRDGVAKGDYRDPVLRRTEMGFHVTRGCFWCGGRFESASARESFPSSEERRERLAVHYLYRYVSQDREEEARNEKQIELG